MSTTRKSRWRNSRNSLPAQRHQRRLRRRHIKRGGTYYPMIAEAGVAKSSISKQLRLGAMSVATAVACFILSITGSQIMILAFLALGFMALAFGVVLIASARREEKLHHGLDDPPAITDAREGRGSNQNMETKRPDSGEDGSL